MFYRLINNFLFFLEYLMVMLLFYVFVKFYEYFYCNEIYIEVVVYLRYFNDEIEFQVNEDFKFKVCYFFDYLFFFFVLFELKVYESFFDLFLFIVF